MEQKLKAGVRDIERCMLDLTWKEKQMGRGASEVEWHLEDRKGLRLKWQEASKKSRWEVGQVYYQRGHWIVTAHILLEKQMRWADNFSEFYLNMSPIQIPHFMKLVYFLGNFPGRWKKIVLCDALRKAIIRKTAELGWGNGAAFHNIFLDGKYCVHNSKLLSMEEQGNIREAYFDTAVDRWVSLTWCWRGKKKLTL